MNSFGEYIKQLRKERNLNQTQVAVQVGLDSGGLSKVETGKKMLKEVKLPLLADALSISLDELNIQFFSDKYAKECFKYKCSPEVFHVAEEKVNYIKSTNTTQTKLNF
ncbi:MAG: helix-turn-helix transcriptional regulator [Paludibacter sp.]